MIEYILMSAMIVGAVLGVMAGIMKPKLEALQGQIADATSGVLSQNSLGIPISWFFGNPQTFDQVGQKLDGASFQGGGGGPTGPGGPGGPKRPGGPDRPGGPNSGPKGPNGDGPNGPNGPNGPGGGGKSGGTKGDPVGGSGKRTNKSSGTGPQISDSGSSGGDTTPETKADPTKDSEEEKANKEAEGETGQALARKKFADGRVEEERRGGSCKDMNLFTLLKLGAVLAIILLGAAVLVTAKGQKGSD